MQSKKIDVAIDLDDVILHFSQALYTEAHNAGLNPKPISMWSSYNIVEPCGFKNYDHFLEFVISNQILSKVKPIEGAREALQVLRDKGFRPIGVTSRGYHPDGHAVTMGSLEENNLILDDLIVVPHGKTKPEACLIAYPGGFEFIVDDYDKNIDDMNASRMIKSSALICKPWNAHREDFVLGSNRFKSLHDFAMSIP